MTIAVASGKGGTGKTTVAANLAWLLAGRRSTQYLDCDVEEPNGHLLLHPVLEAAEKVAVPVPVVERERCDGCGACARACQFRALAALPTGVLTFPELCHGCGGCALVCPRGAIGEGERVVGAVESGRAGPLAFVHGRLRIGEAMSPPLVRAVTAHVSPERLVIIDAPPGTSCPVVAALQAADLVLLVAEPTPFGLHDLGLAADLARKMGKPRGLVINRCDLGDDRLLRYADKQEIAVWASLPHDRRAAEAFAHGLLAAQAVPEFGRLLAPLADRLGAL